MSETRRHGARIIRFGVVGVLNTAIDFALFALLYYVALWPLLAAIAVLAGLSLRPLVLSGYYNEYLDRLLPIVRQHAAGKAIYFISSNT